MFKALNSEIESTEVSLEEAHIKKLKVKLKRLPLYTVMSAIVVAVVSGAIIFSGLNNLDSPLAAGYEIHLSIASAAIITFLTTSLLLKKVNKDIVNLKKDLSEFRGLKYKTKISRIRKDKEGEFEIFFESFHDDIDVKRKIYKQLSIGDECEITIALHSKEVVGVRRIYDGLELI